MKKKSSRFFTVLIVLIAMLACLTITSCDNGIKPDNGNNQSQNGGTGGDANNPNGDGSGSESNPDGPVINLPDVAEADFSNGKFAIGSNGLPLFSDAVTMKNAISNDKIMAQFDEFATQVLTPMIGGNPGQLVYTHEIKNGDFVSSTSIQGPEATVIINFIQNGRDGKWKIVMTQNGAGLTYYLNGVAVKPELLEGIAMPDKSKLFGCTTEEYPASNELYVNYTYIMSYEEAKQFLTDNGIAYKEVQEPIYEEGKPYDQWEKQNVIKADVIKDLKATSYSCREKEGIFIISIELAPLYNWRAPQDNEVTLEYIQKNILNSEELPPEIAYCKMTTAQEDNLRRAAANIDASLIVNKDEGLVAIKFDDRNFYAQDATGTWTAKETKPVEGKPEAVRELSHRKGKGLHPDFKLYDIAGIYDVTAVETTSLSIDHTTTMHIAKFDCITADFTIDDFKALFKDVITEGKFKNYNGTYNVKFECPADGKNNRVTVTCELEPTAIN